MNRVLAWIGEDRIEAIKNLPEEDRNERLLSWMHTFEWWHQQHQEDTEHHQNFRGFCMECQS